MKHKLALLCVPVILMLSGCGERYRYPCQDPTNWERQECKKPYCSANGTCPEDLRHYEKTQDGPMKSSAVRDPINALPLPKGDCNKC